MSPSKHAVQTIAMLTMSLVTVLATAGTGCSRGVATAEDAGPDEVVSSFVPPPDKDAPERVAYLAAAQQAAEASGATVSEGGKLSFTNVTHGLVGDVAEGKVNVRSTSGRTRWNLSLKALRFGYTGSLKPVPAATDANAVANRIESRRGPATETVVNSPLGVRYTLTFPADPGGKGTDSRLLLVLSLQSDVRAALSGDGRTLDFRDQAGELVLRGRDLLAVGGGKPLPVGLTLARDELLIAVNTKDAAFPLAISFLLTPEGVLSAIDSIGDNGFGEAVGVRGGLTVVGAPAKAAAYLLGRTAAGWKHKARLTSKSAGQATDFGIAVAVDGTNVVVGAPRENPDKGGYRGAVHLFSGTGDTYTETAKLQASDATDMLGSTVAIEDDTILVGAPGGAGAGAAGSAYIFSHDKAGTWAEAAKLKAGASEKRFGRSIAISANVAYVAAEGAVHVFVRKGTAWSEKMKIPAPEGEADFGTAISALHDTLYVGAPGKGVVYVFVGTGGAMVAHGTINPRVPTKGFGTSLGSNGTVVLVGTPSLNVGQTAAGGVTAFVRRGQAWAESGLLLPLDPVRGESFGSTLAMSGDSAIIGTRIVSKCPPDCTATTGHAYSFLRLPAKTDGSKCVDDSECNSGSCADGVCCNTRCDGACESCVAANKHGGGDGECGPTAAGTDPRNKCQADPDHVAKCKADGMCDGAGKCRSVAAAGATCLGQSCSGGVQRRGSCDGTVANCKLTASGCAPYTCAGNGVECRSFCATDGECAGGFACSAGTCRKK